MYIKSLLLPVLLLLMTTVLQTTNLLDTIFDVTSLIHGSLCAYSENQPKFRNRYLSIKRRCEYKRAIIAIARMMLTTSYHILKKK